MLKIPNFRGVFMRDSLPKNGPHVRECAVVNLDDYQGSGTHWTAYKKQKDKTLYFDSFGNLRPPQELMHYLRNTSIQYNYSKYQNFNTIICGHLCLKFLCNYPITLHRSRCIKYKQTNMQHCAQQYISTG